jgi:Mg/Co/Ni transporter MgtE
MDAAIMLDELTEFQQMDLICDLLKGNINVVFESLRPESRIDSVRLFEYDVILAELKLL